MSGLLNSSVGRKIMMALSAIFLVSFLLIHFSVNMLSVFSEDAFNSAAHFMGTNWAVQYIMQPILIFGVVYHFVMGFVLEAQNRKAKGQKYFKNNAGENSSWMSRNMLVSGAVILAFLVLHFIDFWVPEMQVKYIGGDMSGLIDPSNADSGFRYFEELQHKFVSPLRVGAYVVAFILLGLHLQHGFASAFQSLGANKGIKAFVQKLTVIFSIVIPAGFIFIALFHHFNH